MGSEGRGGSSRPRGLALSRVYFHLGPKSGEQQVKKRLVAIAIHLSHRSSD